MLRKLCYVLVDFTQNIQIFGFFLQCKAQYYTGKVCMKDSLYGESTVRFEVSFVTQLLLCVLID